MLTGAPDLDDVAALLDADVDGLLPASALAGAATYRLRAKTAPVTIASVAFFFRYRPIIVLHLPVDAMWLVELSHRRHVSRPPTFCSGARRALGILPVSVVCRLNTKT